MPSGHPLVGSFAHADQQHKHNSNCVTLRKLAHGCVIQILNIFAKKHRMSNHVRTASPRPTVYVLEQK